MTSLQNSLPQMPSIGTLGGTLPWGPKSLKVKRQAYPHDGSRGLKRPAPASPPVTDNHHGAGAKGAAGVAGRPKNFLLDIGATYSVLISYSGAFSSQTCTIVGATGKATTKRFTQALLCCWDGQVFSCQFWWSLSVLLPYWEEIYSLNWGP